MESKQIPLTMLCPTGCGNQKVITWVHSSCSRILYLKGNGNIRCDYCYYESGFLKWRFDCGKHQGKYKDPEIMSAGNAIGLAIQEIKSYFPNAKEAYLFIALVQKKILEESYF